MSKKITKKLHHASAIRSKSRDLIYIRYFITWMLDTRSLSKLYISLGKIKINNFSNIYLCILNSITCLLKNKNHLFLN